MAGEGELALRREDANAIIGAGRPRGQQKGRLTQVGPIRECGHLAIRQRIRADNDGERIAAQRPGCEHVDLLKCEIGHVTAPGLIGRVRQKHKEPLLPTARPHPPLRARIYANWGKTT